MLIDERVNNWQVRTKDGVCYQPGSLESVLKWIFENRVGPGDFVFSPEHNDWVPLYKESLLKNCFWQLRAKDGKIYGPISLGGLKQLFLNNQINDTNEVAVYGSVHQQLPIRNFSTLNQWLLGESVKPIDYEQFLKRVQDEIPGTIKGKDVKYTKKIAELKRLLKDKDGEVKEIKLACNKLEKELEKERYAISELRERNRKIEPQQESVLNEIQGLKSEIKEKMLVIEELNKQMAQMEVANTIKDDQLKELREYKEYVESGKDDEGEQIDLFRREIQETEEQANQLRLEKDQLEKDIEEQKESFLTEQKESEDDINRLTNEKEGLQNFIYTLQDDLTKVTAEKNNLQKVISESEESQGQTITELTNGKEEFKTLLAEKDSILEEYKREYAKEIDRLTVEKNNLETKIQYLQEGTNLLEGESQKTQQARFIKDAQIRALLENKEQLIHELELRNELINELGKKITSIDDIHKLEQERFTHQLKDMAFELGHREEAIKHLEQELEGLKESYQLQLKQLENSLARQEGQFRDELAQKTNVLEATYNEEKRGWEETQQKLEGELVQTKAELEGLKESYQLQLKQLENSLARQEGQFRDELAQKTNIWESTYNEEKRGWEETQQKLEAELAGYKEKLESQILEKGRLENEIISQKEEWEKKLFVEAEEFKEELSKKTNDWESALFEEKKRSEELQQKLEGELVQTKAELESQVLEKEKLQVDIAYKTTEWEDRLQRLKEDGRKQYEELVEEREDLQSNLNNRIRDLEAEMEKLKLDLDKADKVCEELFRDKNILQQDLTHRESFIDEIKKGAEKQEQILKEKEELLIKTNNIIGELEDKITGLTEKLQNELEIQNNLQEQVGVLSSELAQVRQKLEDLNTEKVRLTDDLHQSQQGFAKEEKRFSEELDEIKRNWEHAIEENRTLQRQFYLEKQKLTKEYTETINKQSKIEKRNQLDREIADRTRMKEELERLYGLLKGNLEGLQQGSLEIQSSLQQVQSDIDNKRLSLKYIAESEKREEKKGQFPKADLAKKANSSRNGENVDQANLSTEN